ncbi:pyruvate dehydrogenase complex dihydrolipoamide acetyltransferase [Luedemannella flava]|uniref:Dihydrolipoamide acetyltransferase component of pyruvate dehydrogenase complex n=1 Tax=Luedemannella flava TaxID=349316 RepID=A0ABN2M313_9ACTN
MAEFRMPALGADMDSGVLLEWLVHPGDHVRHGDIVAVVDTSKAAIEVECFDTGVVDQLLVQPGTRVPVGEPLALITSDTPEAAAIAVPAAPAAQTAATEASPVTSPLVRHQADVEHVDLAHVHGTGPGGRVTRADVEAASHPAAPPPPTGDHEPRRVRASPLARRLATELGLDLATVVGTGSGGAIAAEDVRQAAAARVAGVPATEPVAPTPVPARPAAAATGGDRTAAMRQTIAALMARSKREIPHYYLTETIDLAALVDHLRARNCDLPVPERLIPAAALLKAAARGLTAVPDLNGFYADDQLTRADAVHLGIAISLRGGGLVAPAIHHADQLTLAELMARLKDLVARTRAGRLHRAELADPTITVSNLGDQGVESFLGVIYPPQVALVGFGRVTDRPWAVAGMLGVRPTVTMSLAADHRVTDGATGARYLTTVNDLLQQPEQL